MSYSKTIVLGRLGQDPELKYTPSGSAVTNLSIATTEYFKDKEGKNMERTEWHRIVVYGKLAETASQYLSKGRQALIEGRNHTRQWDDKNGQKRYTTEIVASSIQFVGDKKDSNGPQQPKQDIPETKYTAADIPF